MSIAGSMGTDLDEALRKLEAGQWSADTYQQWNVKRMNQRTAPWCDQIRFTKFMEHIPTSVARPCMKKCSMTPLYKKVRKTSAVSSPSALPAFERALLQQADDEMESGGRAATSPRRNR